MEEKKVLYPALHVSFLISREGGKKSKRPIGGLKNGVLDLENMKPWITSLTKRQEREVKEDIVSGEGFSPSGVGSACGEEIWPP